MPEQLVLRDCSVSLGKRSILSGVSLALDSPGLYCIIGANGAGKTTLIRLICGLLERASGRIEFAGQDMARLDGRSRAMLISYVPQLAEAGIPLKLEEALDVARCANGQSASDGARVLEQLGLSHLSGRLLSEMSGGELKLAMIAMALAQDTRIMLLDEPTAHLDPPARLQIMQLMYRIAREQGKLVLSSLHYPELAGQFADEVILLRNGVLIDQGDPREMTRPEKLQQLYGNGTTTLLEAAS